MVKENPNIYISEQFAIISKLADNFGEYKEFKSRYSELMMNEAKLEECNSFLIKFYCKVLVDAIPWLLDLITKVQSYGQDLSKLPLEVEQINTSLKIDSLPLDRLHSIRNRLLEIQKELEQKMQLVKSKKIEKWKERFIGFVIAIISGLVLNGLGFF